MFYIEEVFSELYLYMCEIQLSFVLHVLVYDLTIMIIILFGFFSYGKLDHEDWCTHKVMVNGLKLYYEQQLQSHVPASCT